MSMFLTVSFMDLEVFESVAEKFGEFLLGKHFENRERSLRFRNKQVPINF